MTTMESNKLVRLNDAGAMKLMAVPENRDHLYEMCERAVTARLVPSSYNNNVESVFLATLKGAEYGLLPQQSLQGFYVINGAAHPWGTCLRGIVQASSAFEGEMDGCIEGVPEMEYIAAEPNDYKGESLDHALFRELQRALRRRLARVKGKKLPDGLPLPDYYCGYSVVKRMGQEPVCFLFDTFDAHRAGLTGKSGDLWKKYPTRMYMHRAATYARRDVFSSVLIGLDMTAEEAMDVIEVTATEVPRSHGPVEPRPRTTGEVLDHFAGEREPVTARVVETSYTASVDLAKPEPPAPVGGYVPVGEPGSDEKEDKAVPAAASPPAPVPEPVTQKANGNGAKGGVGAQRLKAVTVDLESLVKDKAQINAIAAEAKREALGSWDGKDMSFLPSKNMNDEQKLAFAEKLEEHVARLKAQRETEAAPGGDPDPTDF